MYETTTDPARDRKTRQDFAAIYESHAEMILRYCMARTNSLAEAEDVAATAFSKALAAWPPTNPGAVRSWLFTIAHNEIANHYRSNPKTRYALPLDEALTALDFAATPEEVAIHRDEQRELLAAVAELTPDQQQVVTLRLGGLTGREIAESTGRSEAAVRMLQFRAVQSLRGILQLAETNPVAMSGFTGKDISNAK